MKYVWMIFLLVMFYVPHASAQETFGEVSSEPYCFQIVNTAPYMVIGTIMTEKFTRPDGIVARHRSTFRLKQSDVSEVCTQGPFFEGQTLGLVLRSLVPLFECRVNVTGNVIIKGKLREDGTTYSWVDGYEQCRQKPRDGEVINLDE